MDYKNQDKFLSKLKVTDPSVMQIIYYRIHAMPALGIPVDDKISSTSSAIPVVASLSPTFLKGAGQNFDICPTNDALNIAFSLDESGSIDIDD